MTFKRFIRETEDFCYHYGPNIACGYLAGSGLYDIVRADYISGGISLALSLILLVHIKERI